MSVSRSSGNSAPDLFKDNCKEGWKILEEDVGLEAELIVDLGCLTVVDTIQLRNLDTKQGIRNFSLYLSHTMDGEWSILHSGMLDLEEAEVNKKFKSIKYFKSFYLNKKGCEQDPVDIYFHNKQRANRKGKFLKVKMESYHGSSGGLQYLSVNGKKASGCRSVYEK